MIPFPTDTRFGRSLAWPSIHPTRCGGYTLLELCLALFILAILMGAVVPFTSGLRMEQRLSRPAMELKDLARRARQSAIQEKRAYEIRFGPGLLTLAPAAAGASIESRYGADIHGKVRHWKESDWKNAGGERWMFHTDGTCEPLSVRFEQDGASVELRFHPVTALANEEILQLP